MPGQGVASGNFVVYTSGNDGEEVVVRTLVGEYKEASSNHGRKVYQKVKDSAGADFVDVFLYYWDNRDGPAFEGWWFGNKLGGTQVWSHCVDAGLNPPSTGWKIPWDGAPRSTLHVLSKAEQQRQEAEQKFNEASTQASDAQSRGQEALQQARLIAGDYDQLDTLRQAEELLGPIAKQMTDANVKLTEAQKTTLPAYGPRYNQVGNPLRLALAQVNGELTKVRNTKGQMEKEAKNKEIEEKDMVGYNELMPEATRKTQNSEDLVDKAVIASELIGAAGEDVAEGKKAVEQTEQAVNAAQKVISECRMFLNAKQAAARRFESEKVKTLAATELGKLQAQLQESQNKLNPLKTARQDFAQRQQAAKVNAEVMAVLTPAELDVDKAEEASNLLVQDPTQETLKNAEAASAKASAALKSAKQLIDSKMQGSPAQGPLRQELGSLTERVKAGNQRLETLKGKQGEAAERATCAALLREAEAKLGAVQENVGKAADAEGPFLMGVEELPIEETMTAVKACESAATAANTAVSIARMFLATKLVEAKRFSNAGADTIAKLKEHQQALDAAAKRLTTLKTNTAARRRQALASESDRVVARAEALAAEVTTAVAPLTDDAGLKDKSVEEIKAASEATNKAVEAAESAFADARKFITERQIESKSKDSSSEASSQFVKLQIRLSTAQGEVSRQKKIAASVDARIAARKVVEEAAAKVTTVEEKSKAAKALVDALDKEPAEAKEAAKPTSEAASSAAAAGAEGAGEAAAKDESTEAEKAISEAQAQARSTGRQIDALLRSHGAVKDELEPLKGRLSAVLEELEGASKALKERAERATGKQVVAEVAQRVAEAEAAVSKLMDAQGPFLKGDESLPLDEAVTALAAVEAEAKNAHSAVGGTRTFLATKRVASKRMSPAVAQSVAEELEKFQGQLDQAVKRMDEVKRSTAERKRDIAKREIEDHTVKAEQLVKTAAEDTKALLEGGEGKDEKEEMRVSVEKAGESQRLAAEALAKARGLVTARQREVRAPPGGAASSAPAAAGADQAAAVAELTAFSERLAKLEAELKSGKEAVLDQEHKFVAKKLIKDTTATLEKLEQRGEDARKMVAGLVSDDQEDNLRIINLGSAVEALRAQIQRSGKSADDLFGEIAGTKDHIVEEDFVNFVKALPELAGWTTPEEDLKGAFARLAVPREGASAEEVAKVDKPTFADQFRTRYLVGAVVTMTDNLTVKGGKTVRKLAVNEVLEALAEPVKETSLGISRVKARAVKDGKEGFVTLAGNQGTAYLQTYTPLAAGQRQAESQLKDLCDEIGKAAKSMDVKITELRPVRTGPLEETRATLTEMKAKLDALKSEMSGMRRRLADAEKKFAEAKELQNRRRQEAVERKATSVIVDECTSQADACQEVVNATVTAAEALAKSRGADKENPLAAMKEMEAEIAKTTEQIKKVQELIASHLAKDELKHNSRGPYGDARKALMTLRVKASGFESRCQKQSVALRVALKQVTSDAQKELADALGKHVRTKGLTADSLFNELSKDGAAIPAASMREFVRGLPEECRVKDALLDLALDRFGESVSKLCLLGMVQQYWRCIHEVAMTSEASVKESKRLRKLVVGELVEVLEESKTDGATSLCRMRCRAVEDGLEGWVTPQGNQGTSFLERVSKPYFLCAKDGLDSLEANFESGSASLNKKLRVHEAVELLEGPRKEPPAQVQRLKGKLSKDGKEGWVTLQDPQGNANFELSKLLICRQAIAVTEGFDISDSKPLRKLEVGETLEFLEEQNDEQRTLLRAKVRALSDAKEGWVTLKGNQGTAYVEESDKHYVCRRATPLEAKSALGGAAVREVEVGETLELLEGPKAENTKEGASRTRVRSLADGVSGWLTATQGSLRPWSARFRVAAGGASLAGAAAADAAELRPLAQSELCTALDAPQFAGESVRVRVRADKDGLVGYVCMTNPSSGAVQLEPLQK